MLSAATHIAEASMPLRLTHCRPGGWCPQSARCARRDAMLCNRSRPIDGLALHVGKFCPLFVDVRGSALEAA